MSFFTKPIAKRTRSQRLLYFQECVKNASEAQDSATTTHVDLATSSDESLDSHISSKESDGAKLNNIKSEECENEAHVFCQGESPLPKKENKAHGSAMGMHTYFISSSDDSDEDAVEWKSGSQCEGDGKQSQPISSQSQSGAGQNQADGVTPTSSVKWTKRRIAQARRMATVCVLSPKVYQRFTHGVFRHQQITRDK